MIANTSKRRDTLSAYEADERAKERFDEIRQRTEQLGKLDTGLELALTGFEDPHTRDLVLASKYLRQARMPTLKPILPLMLKLKGKPYTLNDYFPFEPFFRTRMPKRVLLKTGRQVSKTTSLAAQGIICSNSIPFFSTLYVTPLFEMVRRFSHQYVRQFLEESPVKRLFMGSKTLNNVLQRSFLNGSNMFFSYAFLDAERTRGIPADKNSIDEIQDMNFDFLEIIHQTLGGSPWQLYQYAGTPKSLDNTMETLWQDTSQAEWVIKCHNTLKNNGATCGAYNVPCLSHDMMEMIGPHTKKIGPDRAGVICVECAKPLDPRRHGRWVHGIRERRFSFPGYHVPQMIMPMHYANHEKWDELVGRFQGRGNTTRTVFLNEICGESCDVGSKLVTLSDLKTAASLPWKNTAKDAVKHIKTYRQRVLSVDWGGGGGRLGNNRNVKKDSEKRLRTSFTSIAVQGIRGDGRIDVIWGHRSLRTHDYLYEARLCVEAMSRFRCSHIVHDYNGSGAVREVFVRQAGVPENRIIPIAYHPTGRHNLMLLHPATEDHPRDWYSVDKARSLATVCECIKQGLLRFFEFDRLSSDNLGLISDFLALQEEKTTSRVSSDVFVIAKNPNMSDDFAQAVNIGCCSLWYMTESWPDLAAAAKFALTPEMLQMLHPQTKVDWDDI